MTDGGNIDDIYRRKIFSNSTDISKSRQSNGNGAGIPDHQQRFVKRHGIFKNDVTDLMFSEIPYEAITLHFTALPGDDTNTYHWVVHTGNE